MVILKVTRNDLANEKEERRNEQEAFATTKKNLEDEIAKQETEKENVRKTLTAERDALAETNKKEMEALRKNMQKKLQQRYKKEEMKFWRCNRVAKLLMKSKIQIWIHLWSRKKGPPEVSEVQVIAASQMKVITRH